MLTGVSLVPLITQKQGNQQIDNQKILCWFSKFLFEQQTNVVGFFSLEIPTQNTDKLSKHKQEATLHIFDAVFITYLYAFNVHIDPVS